MRVIKKLSEIRGDWTLPKLKWGYGDSFPFAIFIASADDEEERPEGFYPLYIANPEITEASDELIEAEEYCLSVPDQGVPVSRHASIKIKYLDYNIMKYQIERIKTLRWKN